ncbi:MAG TPA: response regulator transcription factor [Actinomycetota bacterium]|nr:response regulator transcription factor [Actinomycetota bacterium]
MIRVVLVDDQDLVRSGFRVLLGSSGEVEVVGEAEDGVRAVEVVAQVKPDVVLMDVRMPRMDGIEATRRIRDSSDAKVLILTTFDLDEYVHEALRAGASGFLLKDARPEELFDAIRVVHAGDALLAPSITRRLIEEFVRRAPPAPSTATTLESLTERELEVLRLVARGLSNAEISASLVVSPATTKTHVSRILTKLGLRDRAQLVMVAYETGLATPGA